jgi:hypothetical protein
MNEMGLSAPIAATSFGVADNDWLNATAPRVAEYSNPGLKDATPFGVAGVPYNKPRGTNLPPPPPELTSDDL